ncbi:MAG: hypothetical protein OSJ45_08985 [Lachnospiraceae bacterium]|nr:hypothetical protein [Lachnospiraceae bacterium]
MNKKSFLRGFGTGILFAAIILGISFSIRTSESATITRAKKLGMVFESNNKKAVAANTEEPVETGKPEASKSPGVTETPAASKKPAATETPAASKKPATSKKPAATETPAAKATKKPSSSKKPSGGDINKKFNDEKNNFKKDIEADKKQLTINDGDWAGKVSKELEDMGIIDDAAAFDKYLIDNGYSGVINSGTYDVSPDDTYHDIAEKITSRFR